MRSFSPLTITTAIRRVRLVDCAWAASGHIAAPPRNAANAPAAWFNVSAGTLEVLLQRYERRSETTYWYEASSIRYAALLEVAPIGFVRRYPGLWYAEL
jgi:hypothetical protein